MKENMQELMLDLLCKKATYGLSEHEERQLADLEREARTGDLSTSFELTAAALAMADLDMSEAMPEQLRSRIAADAERFVTKDSRVLESSSRGSIFNWLGWAAAATACIALALNIYFTRPQTNVAKITQPSPSPELKLTPEQLRQVLSR